MLKWLAFCLAIGAVIAFPGVRDSLALRSIDAHLDQSSDFRAVEAYLKNNWDYSYDEDRNRFIGWRKNDTGRGLSSSKLYIHMDNGMFEDAEIRRVYSFP